MKKSYSNNYLMVNVIKNKVNMGQESKDLYTFIGIDLLGNRNVLGIYLNKPNDNRFILDILEEFKSKGIENIYFMSCLKEERMNKGIKISFPNTVIIPSLTMNIINLWNVLTFRGRNALITQMKKLYTQETYDEAQNILYLMKEDLKDNQFLLIILDKYLSDLEQCYKYDIETRKFLFNHYSFTNFYDIIKRHCSDKEFKDISDISEALKDDFNYIESNKLYTKRQWVNIINHCGKYFENLIKEVVVEI